MNNNIKFQLNEIYEQVLNENSIDFDFYEEELLEPFEEYFDKLREEKLIKEREIYEFEYFKNFNCEIIEMNLFDFLIEYDDYDFSEFDQEIYDNCFDDYYVDEPKFLNYSKCGYNLDYMPNDDLFDNLDCYDYPEGPNENLNGIIFF